MEISISEKIQRLLRTLLVRERMLVLNASDERVIREVKAKGQAIGSVHSFR